jgi:hypothetical protein
VSGQKKGWIAMTPDAILLERLGVLRDQLRAEEVSIQDVSKSDAYYAPFVDYLRNELLNCLRAVNELSSADPRHKPVERHAALVDLQRQSRMLFGEALALRLAPSVRGHADNGMCRIGDRILSELGTVVALRVPQLTTASDSEYFGRSSRVIRLRYPTRSLWDLPVLAHEFAHSFGPLWAIRTSPAEYPRDHFLMSAGLGPTLEVHDEYFCDLLATVLLGPAYVCTCIFDRFAPGRDKDTRTHPADTKRAWWVLKGLELVTDLIQDADDRATLKVLASFLQEFWKSYLYSAGQGDLDDRETKKLGAAITLLFADVTNNLALAPYKNFRVAWGLAADFKEGLDSDVSAVTARDVLNAAWSIRVDCYREASHTPTLEAWAVELLRRIC